MADESTKSTPGAEGIALFKAGDNNKAVPALRQAVHEYPDNFELRMFFGLALSKAEKWADAESQFGTAYDLNSNSAEAAYFQGIAIAKRGRLREAHGMFNVALAINPEHKGARQAEEATRAAAEQVITEQSSARMPGGANLSVGDWTAIEEEAAKLEGRPVPPKPQDDVGRALAELDPNAAKPPARGGARPAPAKGAAGGGGPQIKMARKGGGCLGSVVGAVLLALLLAGLVALL